MALKSRASFLTNEKQNQTNRTSHVAFSPRFEQVTGEVLGILIGSSRCLLLLLLVGVSTLVMDFPQSFENSSITACLRETGGIMSQLSVQTFLSDSFCQKQG